MVITNPLLYKLVENYREVELAVRREGVIWTRVWEDGDHLVTKKMWIGGDNAKEVLVVLARTETTNIRGEVGILKTYT